MPQRVWTAADHGAFIVTVNPKFPPFAVWRERLEFRKDPQTFMKKVQKALAQAMETLREYVEYLGREMAKAVNEFFIELRHRNLKHRLRDSINANSRCPDPVGFQRRRPRAG